MSNGGQVPGAILPNGASVQAPQVQMPQGMGSFGNAAAAGMANAPAIMAMGARAAPSQLGQPVNAPVLSGLSLAGGNSTSNQALALLQQQLLSQITGAIGGLPPYVPQGGAPQQPAPQSNNGIPAGMPLGVANQLAAIYGNPQAGLQGLQAQFPGTTAQTAGDLTNWLANAPQGGNN